MKMINMHTMLAYGQWCQGEINLTSINKIINNYCRFGKKKFFHQDYYYIYFIRLTYIFGLKTVAGY